MGEGLDGALDGLSAIVVAVYLFFVFSNGNIDALVSALFSSQSLGYLEFVIALFLLWQLLKIQALQPASGMLVGGAILAVFIKAAASAGTSEAWGRFGNGQIGLFGLLSAVLK